MIFAVANRQAQSRQNTQKTSSYGTSQHYSQRRHVYQDDARSKHEERENYQATIYYRNRLLNKVLKYKTKKSSEQEKEQAQEESVNKLRLLTIVDTDNFIKQRKVKVIEIRKSLYAWRAFCGIQICYIILAIFTAYYDGENESQWNCLQNIFSNGTDCECIHSYGFVFRCLMLINFFPCFWIGCSSRMNTLAIRSILKRQNRLKMLFSYIPVLAVMSWVVAVIIRTNVLLSGQCSEYTEGEAVQTSSIFALIFIIIQFICMAVEVIHDLHHKITTRWFAKQLGNQPPIYDLSTDEEPDIKFVEHQIKQREKIAAERRILALQRIEERAETRLQNNRRQNQVAQMLQAVLPPDLESQVESIVGLPSPELPVPQILAPDLAPQNQMEVVEPNNQLRQVQAKGRLSSNNQLNDYIDTLEIKNFEIFQSEYDGQAPLNECVVCQEPFTISGGDNLIVFECDPKHYMHKVCATEWLKRHPNCPLCRADFSKQIKKGHAEVRPPFSINQVLPEV